VENILRFEKDFEGAKIVRLESNYRSTASILAAASGLIAHNEGRLGKTLRPGRPDAQDGEKVTITELWDSDEEARMVAGKVEELRRDGHPLAEMAILVRAGFQTRAFEERLIAIGIPYRVVGGLRFYERAEIRDAIAYMRATVQPADDLAFERIVNVPRRGVGDTALRTMHEASRAWGIPLQAAAARLVETGGLKGKLKEAIGGLQRQFGHWQKMLDVDGHVVTVATMLDESGYTDMWKQDKSAEAPGRLENLKELVRALADFETMAGFLDHVALVMENEDRSDTDKVSLMTLHGATGLEFDTVFLPRRVPQPALDGRKRQQGPRGRTPPRLCRPYPCPQARHRQPRREPAHLRELAGQHPQPRPGGTARSACRADRCIPRRPGCRRDIVLRPVPAGRAGAAGDRRLGTAVPPRADRQDPGGRAGVPPEIRLRHGQDRRRRQA
jgi:ATP-dependent exoDNAse (exonuclease V) beta subunit